MTTAGVVLAAGSGSRYSGAGHKLRAELGGRRVIDWTIDAVRGAGLDEVVVIVGADALEDALPAAVTVVPNAEWAAGHAT